LRGRDLFAVVLIGFREFRVHFGYD
jgi:hypothetical protein